MSADSFFYAALAGARADSISSWKQNANEWQDYARAKEAEVSQLQQQLVAWQREAVQNNASTLYQQVALEKIGTTATDVLADEAQQVEQSVLERSRVFYRKEYNVDPFE